jgi:hypothetical protein
VDDEVQRWIKEAEELFAIHGQRDWLSWGSRFMTSMAQAVEAERIADAAAIREREEHARLEGIQLQAEERERERASRRAEREAALEQATEALYADHQANLISADDLVTRMDELDRRFVAANRRDEVEAGDEAIARGLNEVDELDGDEDEDGEDELDDDDDDDEDDDDDAAGGSASRASGKRKRRKTSLGDGPLEGDPAPGEKVS